VTDTVKAALLDDKDVYLRIDELPPEELTDRHLPHITECDLPPFEYRWNAKELRFDPLPKAPPPIPPDALVGIADAIIAVMKHTKTPVPASTAEWLRHYLKSFDYTGEFK
jgi:hypothetical protein